MKQLELTSLLLIPALVALTVQMMRLLKYVNLTAAFCSDVFSGV